MNTDNTGAIRSFSGSTPAQMNKLENKQINQENTETDPVISDGYVPSDTGGAPSEVSSKDTVNSGDEKTVTILYTNDIHGKIKPWNGVGGAENLSGAIKDLREQNPKSILIDAGDFAYNPPFSEDNRFTPMDKVMNGLGYDAMGLGNHEFQYEADKFGGVKGNPNPHLTDNLYELSQSLQFPLVSCNARLEGRDAADFIKSFIIKDIDGVKIGVTSVVTNDLATKNHPLVGQNWNIDSPVSSINKTVKEMKEQGAEVIVVMSHHNLRETSGIIRGTHGVDIVIGSHDHQTADSQKVRDADGNEVMLLEAGSMGRMVGEIKVSVDSSSSIRNISNTMHKVDSGAENASPEIKAIVNEWASKMPKVDQYEDRHPTHYIKDPDKLKDYENVNLEAGEKLKDNGGRDRDRHGKKNKRRH